MQLDSLESFIEKMYRINLAKLHHLSAKREAEMGLSEGDAAEYNVRVREDDKYCRIKREIDLIRVGEDADAKIRLHSLLCDQLEELDADKAAKLRLEGAGRLAGPDAFATANRTWKSRVKEKTDNEDRDFLESCGIEGDVSWIK